MAHYLDLSTDDLSAAPLILLLGGGALDDAGHWQARWEAQCRDCHRLDLGDWENPHRNTWVNKLNLAIHQARRPVVFVAQGLGCLAPIWWAAFEQPSHGNPVIGALLVTPPDVDRPGRVPQLARFGSCPRAVLPFPSYVVASEDDPSCPVRTAEQLAVDWGSRFVLDAERRSQPGDWPQGKGLLRQLLKAHSLERGYARSSTLPNGEMNFGGGKERFAALPTQTLDRTFST